MKLVTVLCLLLLVKKKVASLEIFRARWGNEDRVPKHKCENLTGGETVEDQFGSCLCKPENNTYYDENGFDCASMAQIETLESK